MTECANNKNSNARIETVEELTRRFKASHRPIEEVIAERKANSSITKTHDQLYAEFEERKAQRKPITRGQAREQRLKNKKAVNGLRRERFEFSVGQVNRIQVDMAIQLVRNALHQISLKQDERYDYLQSHPSAPYLYSRFRDQLLEAFPIPLETHAHDKHQQQPALAKAIKKVLPDLVFAFETHPALGEIWSLAAYELVLNPLPFFPLCKQSTTHHEDQEDTHDQALSATHKSHLQALDKTNRLQGLLGVQILPWVLVLLLSSYLFLVST